MISSRLSPLHDALQSDNFPRARWGEMCSMPVPLQLDELARERDIAQVLGLGDASFLPRLVVKGPQAATFLEAQRIAIPGNILSVLPQESEGLVARTGGSEFFLEDGPGGEIVARVEAALGSGQSGVYRMLRQDAALILSGSRAGELFRHVCGFDFVAAQPGSDLVMTQVAGVSCWVLPGVLNGIPVFRLWTDGTFGIYIWRTLLSIARELGGDAVGTAVYFRGLVEPRSGE